MKLVILLVALGVLVWLLRGGSRRVPPRPTAPPAGDAPQLMLSCAQCGLHLPGNEALPGQGGVFCSEAHRAAFEKAHPRS